MFRFDADVKVYVHRDAIDFRKSIAGLSVIVEQALGLDPFARAVYVFRNRRADRLKLLLWERNGFWLMLRRLEADRFVWPRGEAVLELNVEQLHWLLEGIDLQAMAGHAVRRYERV
jgi:transposase